MKKKPAHLMALMMICLAAVLAGCQQNDTQNPVMTDSTPPAEPVITENSSPNADHEPVIYENADYGFRFSLPDSWKGYTIVTEQWEGLSLAGSEAGKVVETGTKLSIRSPEWTSEKPRQDIPILIFTLSQWEALDQENGFHIGAAPMGPSELGRNAGYVFALPARYNFAFPEGYEEVETILNDHPLQPTAVSAKD